MRETNESTPLKEQLFTIPNLLGYLRLVLIPVFVGIYWNSQSLQGYRTAAVVVGLSGITDFLDGFIARKFHQITKLGKALDPIADKLTQAGLVLCLMFRYPLMRWVVALFVVKEGFMAVMGLVMMRRGRMLDGAKWFGKVCTAVLYVVMFVLMLFPSIGAQTANILIVITIGFMLLSFVLYIPVYYRMYQEAKER